MPYVPPDVKWYLAETLMQFEIEGDEAPLVHVNTKLVRADSPEEAYEKAQELGRMEEAEYENPEGKRVTCRFRGLRDLFGIPGKLEDGAELLWAEKVGLTEAQISALVRPKSDLAVFRDDP